MLLITLISIIILLSILTYTGLKVLIALISIIIWSLVLFYIGWKIYLSALKYKNFFTMKSDIENIKNNIITLKIEQFNLNNLYNKLNIRHKNIIHKLKYNPNFFSKRDDSQDKELKKELENTNYMKEYVLSDLEKKKSAEEILKMNMDNLTFIFEKLLKPGAFDRVFLHLNDIYNDIYNRFYLIIWIFLIMCFIIILRFIWQKIFIWKKNLVKKV